MKAMLTVVLMAVLTACGSRPVEVRTGPAPAGEVTLSVTNNLSQPANVYVTSGGNDILVGQVAANSTQALVVSGVAAGSSVSLKARTADGTRTYTKDNVTLSSSTEWTVP